MSSLSEENAPGPEPYVMKSLVDDIEQELLRLRDRNHRKWGFVVYRCTYGDNAAWQRYVDCLQSHLEESCAYPGNRELLLRHEWKVFEGPQFEDISTQDIRRHFRQWCESEEAKREQYDNTSFAPSTMLGTTPRYQFPAFVDSSALASFQDDRPNVNPIGNWYFNIIDAEWKLPEQNDRDSQAYDPRHDGEEPVEGCRANQVGWCKIWVGLFGLELYDLLQSDQGLLEVYIRPGREVDIYIGDAARDPLEMNEDD